MRTARGKGVGLGVIALRWLSLVLVLAGASWSAEAPPKILGVSTEIVVPGTILTLAGTHLSGSVPCTAPPSGTNPAIYPAQLCGVQVFFADEPAGLLYVSARQINFQVSKDAPRDGNADLRVVYDGQSSSLYTIKAGFDKVTVRLDQPAYTNMPLWLKVEFRSGSSFVRYPSLLGPAGFGCNDVEVRRDGKLRTKLAGANWDLSGGTFSVLNCGEYGFAGRLPLHLLHRFDEPGAYEVRLTVRRLRVHQRSGFNPNGLRLRFSRETATCVRNG